MQKSEQRILLIARGIRSLAERVRERCSSHRGWAIPSNLGGMCGLASFWLFRDLKKARFYPRFCCGDCHGYIDVRGKILDVTATQFGFREKVLFGEESEILSRFTKLNDYPYIAVPWICSKTTQDESEALTMMQQLTPYERLGEQYAYHDEPEFILNTL